jgi:hypothetical protein
LCSSCRHRVQDRRAQGTPVDARFVQGKTAEVQVKEIEKRQCRRLDFPALLGRIAEKKSAILFALMPARFACFHHGNNQQCQQQSEEPIRARFCFDVEFQKQCLQENCCNGQCCGFGEGPSTAFLPKKESPLRTRKHEKITGLPETSTNAPKSVQPSVAKGMVFESSLANCLHLPLCH